MSFRIKDKKGYFVVEYYISNLFKGSSGYTVNIQSGWKLLIGSLAGITYFNSIPDIATYSMIIGAIGDFLLSGLEITYVENV